MGGKFLELWALVVRGIGWSPGAVFFNQWSGVYSISRSCSKTSTFSRIFGPRFHNTFFLCVFDSCSRITLLIQTTEFHFFTFLVGGVPFDFYQGKN